MLEQRRALAIQAKQQKEAITRVMEEAKLKKNWKAAEKKIAAVMESATGLQSPSGSVRSSRSQRSRLGSSGSLRRRKKVSSSTSSLPALRNTRSADGGAEDRHRLAAKHYAERAEGVRADLTAKKQSRSTPGEPQSSTYKSPYELVQLEQSSKSKRSAPLKSSAAFAHVQ